MLVLVKTVVILLLVGLNAFFVAAEYSVLRIRRSRLQQLVAEGSKGARLIQALLADTSLLFSGTQLGITVASLLMGWVGEQIIANGIEALLEGHVHRYVTLAVAHSVAVAAAFIFVTVLVMVLGELVPKTLAYERAERVALMAARPLSLFFQITRYPVALLDRISGGVLRLLRPEPAAPHGPPVTTEELKLILSSVRERGLLEEEQEEMIHGVFELDQVRVREIMVPWPKVTCLPLASNLTSVLETAVRDQHTRVPIYDDSRDNVIGILHTKDLLALLSDRERRRIPFDAPFDLRRLLHRPMIVPETMSLAQMLEEVKPRRAQIALVVDEFGTFVGLVTLEDVLEQIVGEIEDEYDLQTKTPENNLSQDVLVLDGSLSLRQLADDYDLQLPRGAGYETLAGFMLERLGAIPRGNETVLFEGRRFTIAEMEGRRVARVRVEKIMEPAAAPRPPAATAGSRMRPA